MTNLLELLNINIDNMSNDDLVALTMDRRRARRAIAKQGNRGGATKKVKPKTIKAKKSSSDVHTIDIATLDTDTMTALLKAYEENYGQSENS